MSKQEQAQLLLLGEMGDEGKKLIETPVSSNIDNFNFELWARAVKPQLLAALRKRTTKL